MKQGRKKKQERCREVAVWKERGEEDDLVRWMEHGGKSSWKAFKNVIPGVRVEAGLALGRLDRFVAIGPHDPGVPALRGDSRISDF